MLTTGFALTLQPTLFVASASGTVDTFEYLNGNPSPDPNKALEAYVNGFTLGFICDFFGASC